MVSTRKKRRSFGTADASIAEATPTKGPSKAAKQVIEIEQAAVDSSKLNRSHGMLPQRVSCARVQANSHVLLESAEFELDEEQEEDGETIGARMRKKRRLNHDAVATISTPQTKTAATPTTRNTSKAKVKRRVPDSEPEPRLATPSGNKPTRRTLQHYFPPTTKNEPSRKVEVEIKSKEGTPAPASDTILLQTEMGSNHVESPRLEADKRGTDVKSNISSDRARPQTPVESGSTVKKTRSKQAKNTFAPAKIDAVIEQLKGVQTRRSSARHNGVTEVAKNEQASAVSGVVPDAPKTAATSPARIPHKLARSHAGDSQPVSPNTASTVSARKPASKPSDLTPETTSRTSKTSSTPNSMSRHTPKLTIKLNVNREQKKGTQTNGAQNHISKAETLPMTQISPGTSGSESSTWAPIKQKISDYSEDIMRLRQPPQGVGHDSPSTSWRTTNAPNTLLKDVRPYLEALSIQLLSVFATTAHSGILETILNTTSSRHQAYVSLKSSFDNVKAIYRTKNHFITTSELYTVGTAEDAKELIRTARIANHATYVISCFGSGDVPFIYLDRYFLETFTINGNRILKPQADLWISLKTQAFLAATENDGSEGAGEEALGDMFPDDLETQLRARRPNHPLHPKEQDLVSQARERRLALSECLSDRSLLEIIRKRWKWEDFWNELTIYLHKNFQSITDVQAAHLNPIDKTDLLLNVKHDLRSMLSMSANSFDNEEDSDVEDNTDASPSDLNGAVEVPGKVTVPTTPYEASNDPKDKPPSPMLTRRKAREKLQSQMRAPEILDSPIVMEQGGTSVREHHMNDEATNQAPSPIIQANSGDGPVSTATQNDRARAQFPQRTSPSQSPLQNHMPPPGYGYGPPTARYGGPPPGYWIGYPNPLPPQSAHHANGSNGHQVPNHLQFTHPQHPLGHYHSQSLHRLPLPQSPHRDHSVVLGEENRGSAQPEGSIVRRDSGMTVLQNAPRGPPPPISHPSFHGHHYQNGPPALSGGQYSHGFRPTPTAPPGYWGTLPPNHQGQQPQGPPPYHNPGYLYPPPRIGGPAPPYGPQHAAPPLFAGPSTAPYFQQNQNGYQSPFSAPKGGMLSQVVDSFHGMDVPNPQQSEPTCQLYEKARAVANAKNNSSARNRAHALSQRRPWTTEEERALMMGLDYVKGPHWSSILAMYGKGGTLSEALRDRNQVQLKDKARNLKLFFLKSDIEVPYYLSFVTGDLKRASKGELGKEDKEADDKDDDEEFDEVVDDEPLDDKSVSKIVDSRAEIPPARNEIIGPKPYSTYAGPAAPLIAGKLNAGDMIGSSDSSTALPSLVATKTNGFTPPTLAERADPRPSSNQGRKNSFPHSQSDYVSPFGPPAGYPVPFNGAHSSPYPRPESYVPNGHVEPLVDGRMAHGQRAGASLAATGQVQQPPPGPPNVPEHPRYPPLLPDNQPHTNEHQSDLSLSRLPTAQQSSAARHVGAGSPLQAIFHGTQGPESRETQAPMPTDTVASVAQGKQPGNQFRFKVVAGKQEKKTTRSRAKAGSKRARGEAEDQADDERETSVNSPTGGRTLLSEPVKRHNKKQKSDDMDTGKLADMDEDAKTVRPESQHKMVSGWATVNRG
jgi:hypothetical protein